MLNQRTILITGAAGNLGSLLSRQLIPSGHELRLMYHRTPLSEDVAQAANVRPIKADLGDSATLPPAVTGADVIVHFAGRLFAPCPERFLPETNTLWFSNLLTAALKARVGRIILISSHTLRIRQLSLNVSRPAQIVPGQNSGFRYVTSGLRTGERSAPYGTFASFAFFALH